LRLVLVILLLLLGRISRRWPLREGRLLLLVA
jgi:hypothetical protein